jgi:regulator of sirC expression with transglutaminase-like and TPR domain
LPDFITDFSADNEFLKLLTRRDDEVDLPRAALELARDADPQLDFSPTLAWIDARAGELSGPLAKASSDEEMLLVFSRELAGHHGLVGNAECYERADSSFLNRVIELKTGLPIALSVLYMAVAERAGVSLHGVGAPVHFLTRYETLDGALFVDAFAGGTVLTLRDCLDRVRETSGLTGPQALAALEPVGPRQIVIRMLNNLKSLYARSQDWHACWKVQHRLLALLPAAFHERRDWALVSLRAGRAGPAINMLESCLATCAQEDRESLQQQLDEARRELAKWN